MSEHQSGRHDNKNDRHPIRGTNGIQDNQRTDRVFGDDERLLSMYLSGHIQKVAHQERVRTQKEVYGKVTPIIVPRDVRSFRMDRVASAVQRGGFEPQTRVPLPVQLQGTNQQTFKEACVGKEKR